MFHSRKNKTSAARKSPLRWLALAAAAVALCKLLLWVSVWYTAGLLPGQAVGVIGGADGPTAIFVTASTTPAASLCQSGSLLLAGLAVFFALQWPAAPRRTAKRLLPAVLAATAALLWLVPLLTFCTAETWCCGAAVALALVLAVRRLRR